MLTLWGADIENDIIEEGDRSTAAQERGHTMSEGSTATAVPGLYREVHRHRTVVRAPRETVQCAGSWKRPSVATPNLRKAIGTDRGKGFGVCPECGETFALVGTRHLPTHYVEL
jgi:phage terminase large subunit GpA-like protein